MAKVTITGDAVVIKSALTMEEIQMVKKYRPAALQLMGGEDNKEVIFVVAPAMKGNKGSINEYGASFGGVSHDDEKKATITLFADGMTGDPKEWVADHIGGALNNLNKVEASIPDIIKDIKADRDAVMEAIELA